MAALSIQLICIKKIAAIGAGFMKPLYLLGLTKDNNVVSEIGPCRHKYFVYARVLAGFHYLEQLCYIWVDSPKGNCYYFQPAIQAAV